jgi:hypothetical protein
MNFDLFLDYRKRCVSLIDSYGEAPDCMREAVSVPFVMSSHIPVVPVKIGGKAFSLGLDTGAAWNAVGKEQKGYFEESGLVLGMKQDDIVRFNPEDSEQGVSVCSLKGVTVGGAIMPDGMDFVLHNIETPGVKAEGLMGYELFSRYRTLIRFAKRELLLQPYDPE